MNRASTLVVFLLLIAGATYFLFWGGGSDKLGGSAPLSMDSGDDLDLGPGTDLGTDEDLGNRVGLESGGRELMAADFDLDTDEEYQAALAGFKGRILSAKGEPIADTLVQLFRFAPDAIFSGQVGMFVGEGDDVLEPDIDAGETRTSDEGRFLITGVLPQAFFLLKAGVDSDAPSHRIIDETPGPGEIVDLGDILLDDAGILVGEVVDADGEPIAGALIRAVDLPGGELLAMVPIERFDPEGALIVKVDVDQVIRFPKWVKRRFDQLPIPSTRSDAEGKFRLVGVAPGRNLVAITAAGHLSNIRSGVQVKAGKEKSLGRTRLREGEEVYGKVLDEEDRPVEGAEVFIANQTKIAPIHFAFPAVFSDAEGKFQAIGFSPGDVIAAVRRGPGHPWLISEPQSLAKDLLLRLPALYSLTITLTSEVEKPIEQPRLQLTPGKLDEGSVMMTMWGLKQPVKLQDRLVELEDGRFQINNLGKGQYTLLADSNGHAAAAVLVDLQADQEIVLELPTELSFMVFVNNEQGAPVRNAAIYAEARGEQQRLNEMPILCGRTDAQGMLEITQLRNDRARISAQHPAYGAAHTQTPLPPVSQPVMLTLATPGSIEGVLTEKGQPPLPGKWTLMIYRMDRGDERGAMPNMPALAVADLEGKFEAKGLKPGRYTVRVFSSLDNLRSPGAFQMMMMDMMMNSQSDISREVEVFAGRATKVTLDAAEEELETGPVGMLHGNVLVDGRLGTGMLVRIQSESRSVSKEVDQSGRFDFGAVRAGDVEVQLMESSGVDIFSGGPKSLWRSKLKLEEGDDKELSIVIATTSIAGRVLLTDSTPVAGAMVFIIGRKKGGEEQSRPTTFNTVSNERGEFSFPRVPEAIYDLRVKSSEHGRGGLQAIEASGSMPRSGLQVTLNPVVKVSGQIDLSSFANGEPGRIWLQLQPTGSIGQGPSPFSGSTTRVEKDGSFAFDDVSPGIFKARIFGQGKPLIHQGEIVVGSAGLEGLVIHLVEEVKIEKPAAEVEPDKTKGK